MEGVESECDNEEERKIGLQGRQLKITDQDTRCDESRNDSTSRDSNCVTTKESIPKKNIKKLSESDLLERKKG